MTSTEIGSIEIEERVLGSMINSPENLKIVLGIVKEDDFSIGRTRIIFSSIKKTHETRGSVDMVLLGEHLKTIGNGYFESLGGFPYLGTGQK